MRRIVSALTAMPRRRQQAFAGAPAQRMADQMHDDAQPVRVLARAAPRPPAIDRAKMTVAHADCGTATD